MAENPFDSRRAPWGWAATTLPQEQPSDRGAPAELPKASALLRAYLLQFAKTPEPQMPGTWAPRMAPYDSDLPAAPSPYEWGRLAPPFPPAPPALTQLPQPSWSYFLKSPNPDLFGTLAPRDPRYDSDTSPAPSPFEAGRLAPTFPKDDYSWAAGMIRPSPWASLASNRFDVLPKTYGENPWAQFARPHIGDTAAPVQPSPNIAAEPVAQRSTDFWSEDPGEFYDDAQIVSDATPDNYWIPGAQYTGVGHHYAPRAIYGKRPLPPETREVFDKAASGHIHVRRYIDPQGDIGRHVWDKLHKIYSDAVDELFEHFLRANNITAEQMRPDHARSILKAIAESDDPRIRFYNDMVRRLRMFYRFRTGGRGGE